MTGVDCINAVQDIIFVRGFNCINDDWLVMCINNERTSSGQWPEPITFAERWIQESAMVQQATLNNKPASPVAGASTKWLAVHEAGHAIVGIRSGLHLRGIRFYGEGGPPGETRFELFDWASSTDEKLLRHHIKVDVAANLAELIMNVREPDGGHPSKSFPNGMPAKGEEMPSDVQSAWERAYHLAQVLSQTSGYTDTRTLWEIGRAIIAQAEREAQQVLQNDLAVLACLADQLQCGPMTGTAVRAIVGG